ncbi:MAG: hypothetical protein ACLPSH_04265 [Vulcanimicrobiaceae bacterium]
MTPFARRDREPSTKTEPTPLRRAALKTACAILWLSESFIEDETMLNRLRAVEMLEQQLEDEVA